MNFHLTAEAASIAAAAAYRNGELGFQRDHTLCKYRYEDGGKCAIGAGLPDDVAEFVASAEVSAIGSLIDRGFITTDDDVALIDLQEAHDNLCGQFPDLPEYTPKMFFVAFLVAVNSHLPMHVQPITADDWAGCPHSWRTQ